MILYSCKKRLFYLIYSKEDMYMSKQSDCEMLCLMVLEVYSNKYHISQKKATNIFHDNQVFEKILIQHEYLHQVGIEEVIEYVESIISAVSRELIVYHGSCFYFDEIDLTKSHNRRDFGKGFYTTLLKKQAENWADKQSLRLGKEKYYVNEYIFEEDLSLNVKRFDTLNEEWLEFVKDNRNKGGLQHNYDVVIGPVADDNTMETVQLYISNTINSIEAVERLRHFDVNNQVSFHSKKALAFLKMVRRNEYVRDLHI